MTMEGRRFGAGLVGGLLVALAVVTAAGGFGSNPASLIFAPAANLGAANVPTTTISSTVTLSQTTTFTSTSSVGTFGEYTGVVNPTSNRTNSPTTASSSTSSSITSINGSSQQSAGVARSAATKYSSRVDNIASQPFLSDAVILLPVLVAFLLGAVIYRVSSHEKAASTS